MESKIYSKTSEVEDSIKKIRKIIRTAKHFGVVPKTSKHLHSGNIVHKIMLTDRVNEKINDYSENEQKKN